MLKDKAKEDKKESDRKEYLKSMDMGTKSHKDKVRRKFKSLNKKHF